MRSWPPQEAGATPMRFNRADLQNFPWRSGVSTEIAYPTEPGGSAFLELRRTFCSSYPLRRRARAAQIGSYVDLPGSHPLAVRTLDIGRRFLCISYPPRNRADLQLPRCKAVFAPNRLRAARLGVCRYASNRIGNAPGPRVTIDMVQPASPGTLLKRLTRVRSACSASFTSVRASCAPMQA